jgi:hypothetical protein
MVIPLLFEIKKLLRVAQCDFGEPTGKKYCEKILLKIA